MEKTTTIFEDRFSVYKFLTKRNEGDSFYNPMMTGDWEMGRKYRLKTIVANQHDEVETVNSYLYWSFEAGVDYKRTMEKF